MSRTTIPPDGKCRDCRAPMVTRYSGRTPAGFKKHNSQGLCMTCYGRTLYRARFGPAWTPQVRARAVPRAVLLEEVPMLRSCGVSNERIAERLGMRLPTLERALYRAGIQVDRARWGMAA